MTPFRDPHPGTAEYRFNNAHIRARNCIERCIGSLKMRFRCLTKERTARYKPTIVANFLKICAALHNLCLQGRINFEEIVIEEIVDNDNREVYE